MIFGLPSESIAAWASIIIALSALGTAFWQGWIMRKHNRLSVTPLLTITLSQDARNEGKLTRISYKLQNAGTGPAIVESCSLFFKGKEISTEDHVAYLDFILNLVSELENAEFHPDITYQRMSSGRTVAVNQEFEIFGFDIDQSNISQKIENRFFNDVDIMIKYYSIYRDKQFVCSTKEG